MGLCQGQRHCGDRAEPCQPRGHGAHRVPGPEAGRAKGVRGCPTQAMTPLPFPPRGQGGGHPLRPHTWRLVLPGPGRKDFLHPGQGTTTRRSRTPAARSRHSRAERLRQPAKPRHLAWSGAVVATSPPVPSAPALTHLAGTRLLRPDLTAWPRQPGSVGSAVVGVPEQHPRWAEGCGHARGLGCSLGAWVRRRRGARRSPRTSSGRGSQASGPASAGGRELPSPSPRRRRGEAGGGALPEPHGGLEEEPLPRQQLRASFTPENRVPALPPQPHGSGQCPGPPPTPPRAHPELTQGLPCPWGQAPPVPALAVHQHTPTHMLLSPSKDRDGDKASPKGRGRDTAGQGGAGDRQSPFHTPLTAQPWAAQTRPCLQSHADRVTDTTNTLVTPGPGCQGVTAQAVPAGWHEHLWPVQWEQQSPGSPHPPTLPSFLPWLQKIPGFYPKMPPPSVRTPPRPAPIATVP